MKKNLTSTLLALALVVPAQSALAEIAVVPLDTAPEPVLTAAPVESEAPSARAPKLDGPHESLVLPYYVVDTQVEDGDTALLAIRNSGGATTTVDIAYYNLAGDLQAVDLGFMIEPNAVLTRSLRFVALPPDPDGFARGWAQVTGASGSVLSGDFFQVDADENFATGSRLIGDTERCQFWDVRFLQGGGFDGGTVLYLFTDNPRGTGAGDPPTLSIIVYDEAGSIFGTVGIKMSDNAARLPVGNVIAALPGGIGPSFGSMWLGFGLSPGGYVLADYSALGRYSVGLKANCLDASP